MIDYVSYLLAVFFLLAGSIKVFGRSGTVFEKQLEYFKAYGFNRQFMRLVGVVEVSGAILVLLTSLWLSMTGAVLLAGVSASAIFCHLRFDSWKEGIPAMVTLCLSLTVAVGASHMLFA